MIILTGRLEALSQQLDLGETMADIGTDHGFLPISQFEHGTCPKVIMTDVSQKALSRAVEHGRELQGLSGDSFRCGDGLTPIKPGEVQAVVIAGLGGILMTEILAADISKTKTFSKLILQPRNHPEVLRHWLYDNGFVISHETLVRERRNLCEIIVATPNKATRESRIELDPTWPMEDIRWEVPPFYSYSKDPLMREYLHKKLEREQRVRREVQKGRSIDPGFISKLEIRIAYLKELIKTRGSNDSI